MEMIIDDKRKKGKMNRKKELAMLALLEKSTIAAAAKAVGVGEATIYNWMREESSQKDYRALKQEVVGFIPLQGFRRLAHWW